MILHSLNSENIVIIIFELIANVIGEVLEIVIKGYYYFVQNNWFVVDRQNLLFPSLLE